MTTTPNYEIMYATASCGRISVTVLLSLTPSVYFWRYTGGLSCQELQW